MSKIGKLRQRLAFIHNIKPDTGHDLRQLEREVFQEPDISMVSGEKVWKPILNKKGEPELEGATSVENLSATHQYSEGGPNYMEPGGGDPKMRGLNYALEEKDWDEGRGGGLADPDKRIPPSYVVGSEGDAGANTDIPNRLESGSEQRPWSDFAKREILRQRLDNAPLKKSRSLPKAMNTKREREEVMKRNITQENAVLWSKLKQRIAQVRLAYASPPKDVINAFRNKETLKMHAKKKGGGELSFQTDGKTLYQLSPDPPQKRYEIATWVDDGLEWSYENHPTPSTSQAGRMLGINTFTKDGKTFVDGKEVNPYSYDRTFVPNEHLQEGTVKVNPRAHVKKYKDYTPEEKQKIKDQDVFRQKANKQWKETKHLGGHIITDPDTGEIYDQAKIQPHEQKEINRILGYEKELPRESFVKDFHHANPVSKKSGPTGGIFDRVSPSGSVPLGKRGHAEAHDPAGTIPPSFRKRILKARLKIARMRQRNISRRVTQINMAKEDYDPDNAWFEIDRELDRLENTPGSEGNWTYHKGKLVNFEHEKDTLDLLDSVEGDPKHSMFSVSNTHDITNRKDAQLKTKFNEFVKQGYKPTVGRWEGKFDATVNFRDKDRKQVEKIARGELDAFGKPLKNDKGKTLAQQSYVETTEIPRKAPTGPRKYKTKFFNYNEETDTYEE